jgi:hypothetical protein
MKYSWFHIAVLVAIIAVFVYLTRGTSYLGMAQQGGGQRNPMMVNSATKPTIAGIMGQDTSRDVSGYEINP